MKWTLGQWADFFERNSDTYYDITGDSVTALEKTAFLDAISVLIDTPSPSGEDVGKKPLIISTPNMRNAALTVENNDLKREIDALTKEQDDLKVKLNIWIDGLLAVAKDKQKEVAEIIKERDELKEKCDQLIMDNMTHEYSESEAEKFRPEYERQLLEPLQQENAELRARVQELEGKYEKCIKTIRKFDAGIISMYDL
jgi:hypothetical protein